MAQFPLSNLLDGTKTLATKIYNATGELFTPTNPGSVQLSGRNAIKIPLVNAIQKRNANAELTPLFDTNSYKAWDIFVTNTLDQSVKIGFFDSVNNQYYSIGNSDGSVSDYGYNGKYHLIPSGAKYVPVSSFPLTNTVKPVPFQSLFESGLRISYPCSAAPTTGSLSIWIVGVLN